MSFQIILNIKAVVGIFYIKSSTLFSNSVHVLFANLNSVRVQRISNFSLAQR